MALFYRAIVLTLIRIGRKKQILKACANFVQPVCHFFFFCLWQNAYEKYLSIFPVAWKHTVGDRAGKKTKLTHIYIFRLERVHFFFPSTITRTYSTVFWECCLLFKNRNSSFYRNGFYEQCSMNHEDMGYHRVLQIPSNTFHLRSFNYRPSWWYKL